MDDNTQIALERLKQQGYRVTKQRESMVAYLGKREDYYLPVTELDRYMRAQYSGLSHDTIYRNVKAFIELGIVESQMEDDQIVVKLQCDFQHPHHHHFVCTNCGQVTELKMCPLGFFEQQIPGAKIQSHNFELYGLCANCQAHAQKIAALGQAAD